MMNSGLDTALRMQVRELFVGRRLFEQAELLALSLPPIFWKQLGELQSAIYSLDTYYESTWCVEGSVLVQLWEEIERCLAEVAPGSSSKRLLMDIRAYERLEASFRHSAASNMVGTATYYQLKTCDVRLSRQLIEMRSNWSRSDLRLGAWNIYDLASELLDDVADLPADVETFNGNRLLVDLIRHDAQEVIGGSLRFLENIERRARRLLPRLLQHEREPLYWCFDMLRYLRSKLLSHEFAHALSEAKELSLLKRTFQGQKRFLTESALRETVLLTANVPAFA